MVHLSVTQYDYDDERHRFEIYLLYDDVEVGVRILKCVIQIVVHDAVDELWRDYD